MPRGRDDAMGEEYDDLDDDDDDLDDDQRATRLGVECHYLDAAMSKLDRKSSEHEYLRRKLRAATERLDAIRRRRRRRRGPTPSSAPAPPPHPPRRRRRPSRTTSSPRSPYFDEDDDDDDDDDDDVDVEDEDLEPPDDDDVVRDRRGNMNVVDWDGSYPYENGGRADDRHDFGLALPSSSCYDDERRRERGGDHQGRWGDDDDGWEEEEEDGGGGGGDGRTPLRARYGEGDGRTSDWRSQSRNRRGWVVPVLALALAVTVLILTLALTGKGKVENQEVATSSSSSSSPSRVGGPCASFSMHLIPDKFGNETMWKVMRYVGDDVTSDPREYWQGGSSEKYYSTMSSGGPYSYRNDFDGTDVGNRYEMVEATTCLPVGSYVFALYDVSGDGICCDYGRGEYGINLSRGKVIRPLSLGEFSGHVEATFFEVAAEDIDVSPPSSAAEDNPPSAPCASFEMHLVLDQFGNETSWEVVLSDDHPTASPGDVGTRYLKSSKDQRKTQESSVATKVVLSGGPYSYKGDFESEAVESHYNAIVAETCLPVGSYNFVLYDVGGDGICCDYGRGEYGIALKNGRVVRPLSHGGFSGASEITPFEVTADDVDVFPEGYSHPNDVVVATADADAAACPGDVFECPYGGGYLSRDPENDCEFGDCPLVNHDYAADVYAGGDASSTDDAEISPVVQNTSVIAPTTTVDSLNSFVTVTDIDVTTGRGKSYGVLFDIEATQTVSSLVIAGMDLYLDKTSPTHYEIWTKQGSWQLMESENSDYFEGFHQVSHGSITGKGPSEFTKIEIKDFHEVNIEGGQRQAFWVTLSDNNLIFKNNEGEGVSRHEIGSVVQAASEAFNVYFGAAVRAYPLENADPMTDFWYNAGFLGRVWYKAI